jgi:hypothetical protein
VSWSAQTRYLGQWPVALGVVFMLATLILLPGLDEFGIWEMQERQLADKAAPRAELDKPVETPQQAAKISPSTPIQMIKSECERVVPKDAVARSLTPRAARWGRDTFGDWTAAAASRSRCSGSRRRSRSPGSRCGSPGRAPASSPASSGCRFRC